jgi:polyhydroxyalkanoate synthesis regulator phasin
MPFGQTATEDHTRNLKTYQQLIKPVLHECGFKPIRADELRHPGNITRDIIELLYESDLVIADLSGKNANVFYELGVRHALFRYGTILIIRKGDKLPFDIANYRAIFYSMELDGPEEFRNELLRRIKAFDPGLKIKPDNPVHDILGDRLLKPEQPGGVSKVEYDARVAEIERLKQQIGYIQGLLDDYESERTGMVSEYETAAAEIESLKQQICDIQGLLDDYMEGEVKVEDRW